MVKRVLPLVCMLAIALLASGAIFAQLNPTGNLSGTVTDAQGKAVVGATVDVVDAATAATFHSQTGADGRFLFANMPPGSYTVSVATSGFKKGIYNDVKVIVGQTYDLDAKLEVGELTTSVVVEAGQQLVETANTNVGYTITGRAITNLPFNSTNALDLAVLDPGAQTVGRPRNSAFEGLPKGTMNITFDGINVQDNLLKSNDGFFANIRPRVDDVEEFGITTAANSPDKAGEGAVQMSFVSKRGGNSYHGGVWEYARNDAFNSNYYFNTSGYNTVNGVPTALARQVERFNEYGFKIGGPIFKDKLFFFADADFYSFPLSVTRSPIALTPAAAGGKFTYVPVNASNQPTMPGTIPSWETCTSSPKITCTADLLALASQQTAPAGAAPLTSQLDPAIAGLVNPTLAAASVSGVTIRPTQPTLNTLQYNFSNRGIDSRRYPDFRMDWNITQHHSLEFDYHYSHYLTNPDTLNSADAPFPVAPFTKNTGSQLSNRNLWVAAWRWTIGNTASNELRAGAQLAPTNFNIGQSLSFYPSVNTNLGSLPVRPAFPTIQGAALTNPLLGFNTQGRNTGLGEITDNFSWTKGSHSFSFGADVTLLRLNDFFDSTQVGSVGFGVSTSDTAITQGFTGGPGTNGTLPNISSTDLAGAQGLYSFLTGRVGSLSATVSYDPVIGNFRTGAPEVDKASQNEIGIYFADSWSLRPNLKFNYGLRWEYDGPPWDPYNQYFMLQNGAAGVYGVSGTNNLFNPGSLNGFSPTYVNDKGLSWYDPYYKAFAPSVGVAWQPNSDSGILKPILGGPGKTVIRTGYSIAYSREGLEAWQEVSEDNPGYFGSQLSNPAKTASLNNGQYQAGSINLNTANFQQVAQTPSTFVQSFAITPSASQGTFAFAPNFRPPMTQSWTFGLQRELTPSMVMEVSYRGNHGTGLYRAYSVNETNIFENGFLNEFNHALSNLNICKATPSCASSPSFANLGLAGQVALPIMTGTFTGSQVGSQTDPNFKSGTFINDLTQGLAGAFANSINGQSNFTFWQNFQAAGFAKNFWVVNPDARGGSTIEGNASQSTYNALVIDFRKRPSHGLQFDANYTFAKSLTNAYANSAVDAAGFTTLRNEGYDKGPSAFDIRHAVKGQMIYEFPFGEGKRWSSHNMFINRLIGGWQFNSVTRWQSGPPVLITSGLGGTFDSADPGINLVGLTASQLQSLLGTTKAPGTVFYVPTSLLDSAQQKANPSVVQGCQTAGQLCQKLFTWGPQYFRADWSLEKDTKITERVTLELRAELLNAFNDADFYWGPCSASTSPCTLSAQSQTFGKVTNAYQDFATTQDPGGRVVQLVGRINF